jgi:hypothetical protein
VVVVRRLSYQSRVRERALSVVAVVVIAACGSSPAAPLSHVAAGGAADTGQGGGTATGGALHATGGNGESGRVAAASSGGTAASGAGSDDAGNSGDVTAHGGAAGAASAEGGAGGADSSCDFKVTWSISENIPTVGIVEWMTGLADVRDATIEFGLDTSYGMKAPVDLSALNYRTLLIGLKASHAYHFRIVAHGRTQTCTSDDTSFATGPAPNGLPTLTVTDHGGEHFSGFLLSSFITSGPAFMIDADGDYVWAYGSGEMGRAALSNDGKYVWYGAVNLAGNAPSMKRVTLDGLEETDFTAEFADLHHDFTLLPDDTIAFLAHHDDSDLVLEHAPDGTVHQVLDVGAVLGTTHTHANSIHYHPEDDSYTVSELAESSFIKFGRDGHVSWILGGAQSNFSGDGASWSEQHGHRLLAPDRMLFFSNGDPAGGTSSALEVSLDLDAMTATRVWQYQPGPHCLIYGDVERLANNNTLVTFSTLGLIHEVSASGDLVRELTWSLGGALGYVTRVASPYPPFE